MDIIKIIFLILFVISLIIFIAYSIFTFYFILSKKKHEISENEYNLRLKKIGIRNIALLIILMLVTLIYTMIS